jgi:DNA-binding transcriptional LysR family regulator
MHIIPHLGPFLEQHPEMTVDVVLDDRSLNLVEEGIDVALRMGNLSDSSHTARKIGESPCVILGTPAYFALRRTCDPQDLLQHQAIIYTRVEGSHWNFTRGDTQFPLVAHGRVRVTAAEGARRRVESFGVDPVVHLDVRPGAGQRRGQDRAGRLAFARKGLVGGIPTGRMASAKARAFVEYVEQLLKR